MTITITKKVTDDELKLDESGGIQFQNPADDDPDPQAAGTPDDDDDDDVALAWVDPDDTNNADGFFDLATSALDDTFLGYLNTLVDGTFLSDDQLAYAASVGGTSDADYLSITTSAGENISSVFFSAPDGGALAGAQVFHDYGAETPEDPLQTIDGQDVFLWTVGDGSIVLATTSGASVSAGSLVAAFYLESDLSDSEATQFDVKVESVVFVPFDHPDGTDPDDAIDFSEILNVSASGTLGFEFDTLESGNFLWVAVGDTDAALLVTGQDLDVNTDEGSSKYGDIIKGGSDPSDTVNTSQGGINATIGILSQHFTDAKEKGVEKDGPVGVFTLVKGFEPLDGATDGQATGINILDIDYDDVDPYVDAPSASVFISQTEGGGEASLRIELFSVDEGPAPEEGFGYIGDTDTDQETTDDDPVAVVRIEVTRGDTTYVWFDGDDSDASTGEGGDTLGGITVDFLDSDHPTDINDFVVSGVMTGDVIRFFSTEGETFNRFTIQAKAGSSAFDIGRIEIDEGVIKTTAVGQDFLVDDDGPTATASGTPEKLVLDETAADPDPDGANDAPAGTTTVTSTGIAALFGGDFGSDGAGSTAFSLDLSNQDIGSGLFEIDDTVANGKGDEILLYQTADDMVIGYVGTDGPGADTPDYETIFTITIDTNSASGTFGEVTFAFGTDYANIWHPDYADGDADDAETLTVGVNEYLRVVQELTDADGDKDSSYRDLGTGVFGVEDDGPLADAAGAPPALTVDETDAAPDPDGPNDAAAGTTSDSASFTSLFAGSVFGSDGAGSTSYGLELSADGIGSGVYALDATQSDGKGDEILLYRQDATTIIGYLDPVGNGEAGDYVTYFTITVDNDASDDADVGATTAFGDVTFTQVLNVWHPLTAGGKADDAVHIDVGDGNELNLVQTVTDADLDNDSASFDLGHEILGDGQEAGEGYYVFSLEDDGPTATASGTPEELVLDETVADPDPDGANDAPAGTTTVTSTGIAALFGGDFGSDGAGSTAFSLDLSNQDIGSGLFVIDDTVANGKGEQILLYQTADDTVIGYVGTDGPGADTPDYETIFTITIDTNSASGTFGEVTFAFGSDYDNIWHPDYADGDADDVETLTVGANEYLRVVQELTDADGDKDSSYRDLGTGVFGVEDDGPLADAAGAPPALTVDETDAAPDPDGPNDAAAGTTSDSASFTSLFAGSVFGSDGAGSTSYGLELSADGIGSGVYALDAAQSDGKGDEILLYRQDATTIIGYLDPVGNDEPGDYVTYFTITVDNDASDDADVGATTSFGDVTFTQVLNVWHPLTADGKADDAVHIDAGDGNELNLVQTVTDADLDNDSASFDLGHEILGDGQEAGEGYYVFSIEDDGPKAGTPSAPSPIYLDETTTVTDPGGTNQADAGISSAKSNFGTLFSAAAYGSDGAGSTVLSLEISANGIGSGLFSLDADETDGKGDEILLYRQDATTIVGYVDPVGDDDVADYVTYFTITVDTDASDDADVGATTAFGDVTFTQVSDVWHGNTGDDDDLVSLYVDGAEESFVLRQTVADADGDSDTSDMDLSANIFFIEDDGPQIDETTIADNLFVGNMIGDSVSDDFTFSNVADAPWAWVITDAPGDFDDTSPYPADVFTWRYADVDEDGEVGQHEIIGTYDGDDLYSLIITDDGSGTATYELEMIGALDGGSRELDSANIKAGGPDTNFIDVGIIGAEASDFVRISGYFDDDGIDTGDDPVPAAVNESNLNVGVKNGNLDSGEILGFSLFENGESEPPTDISGIIIGTKTAQGFNYAWKAYGVDEEGDPVTYDGSGSVGKNEPIIIDVGALVHTIELYNLDGDAVKIGLDDIEILTDPPDFLLNFEGVLHDADGDAYGFDFTVGIDGNDSGALVDPIMVDPLPATTAFELMHVDPIA